jgi:hypothetical protein
LNVHEREPDFVSVDPVVFGSEFYAGYGVEPEVPFRPLLLDPAANSFLGGPRARPVSHFEAYINDKKKTVEYGEIASRKHFIPCKKPHLWEVS